MYKPIHTHTYIYTHILYIYTFDAAYIYIYTHTPKAVRQPYYQHTSSDVVHHIVLAMLRVHAGDGRSRLRCKGRGGGY